jgi:lambda family phage portal protein
MILDQYGQPINTKLLATQRKMADRTRRADSLTAAYDAAQNTVENRKHWRWADGNSAAAANSIEVRKTLRQRARYECLEANSFGKGICLTLTNDTISSGPSLQVTLPNSAQSRLIEQRWRQWCKATRIAEKLRTARLSKIIDGEIVLLKTTNRSLRTPVQLDIRLIEADMLATPGFVDGQVNKVDGIEFDDHGNPVQYHILKGHPGDVWPFQAWEKIDVHPDDMIHMFRVERPGQVRGIPEITPALPLFAYLRRYTLAVISAAEIAADFAAVLQTQSNAFASDDGGVDDVDPFDSVQIDRGMLTSLPKGWQMAQFKPEQPTTTYEMFRNAILNEIARCVHMPSNKALADSSKYNYSSGRLDHQTYYEAIAIERSEWEINCLDRIFDWWLDEALMLDGYIELDTIDEVPHVWRWPPNKDVDPESDAKASIELINAGLMTEEQYLIAKNIDPESHYSQLAAQQARKSGAPSPGAPTPIAPSSDAGAGSVSDDPKNAEPTSAEPAPAPTGEFANMSRLQMQRNMKAIDDALNKLSSGEWTESRARVFLSSIGLTDKTIDNLLSELTPTES